MLKHTLNRCIHFATIGEYFVLFHHREIQYFSISYVSYSEMIQRRSKNNSFKIIVDKDFEIDKLFIEISSIGVEILRKILERE